jgi:hypothetical protein
MELTIEGRGGVGVEVEAGEHTNVASSVPYWIGQAELLLPPADKPLCRLLIFLSKMKAVA